MLAHTLLLALAATGATASYHNAIHPGALAAKRDLSARQTQTDDDPTATATDTASGDDCLDGLMSIYSSLPTPPPEILSWEESATFTDPCSVSVPASLSSAFSSYEDEALSWYTQHSSEIFAALSQCPELSSIASGAAGGDAPVCTADATAGPGGAGSGPTTDAEDTTTTTSGGAAATTTTSSQRTTGTGTTSSRTGSSTTSSGAAATATGNAGHRETAFLAGAAAVAGFLGVVAAL
ncbi:hypothetical protein NKR19_g8101 [Coniochaeta hoffmannii]|uniref:DUF7735 domain-containing protein n=1 Tax=Coniochaeta hoffmannii TaxID=91930 RepID=A0AA38R7U0_9PEZI|nr:hypothetical protein NKR19_g8101 [Coniochaeta hoffmannii]